jgi:hypothetical protein
MKKPIVHFFLFFNLIPFLFSTILLAKDFEVVDAGVKEANGIYKEQGTFKGHPKYVKGNCEIRYKGCRSKWMLYINNKHYYKNKINSKECPLTGWQIACGAKKISLQKPKLTLVTHELKKELRHELHNR